MKSKLVVAENPIINQQSYLPSWRELVQALPAQPVSGRKRQGVIDIIMTVLTGK